MKTITLRTLVREPRKVKRMTTGGQSVQVTDHGVPLWILTGATHDVEEAERIRVTDQILDEVLAEKPSRFSISKFIVESR